MTAVAELFTLLSGDAWRLSHPFSDDLLQANALLHNDAATEAEMAECLNLWCLRKQPCQFGRLAAKQGNIHFSFLTDEAVSGWSDEEVGEKIAEAKRLWKQRAAFDPGRSAHSFVLVVASPRVAFAAPDQHLRAFSDRILELAGWGIGPRAARQANTVTSDFLPSGTQTLVHSTDTSSISTTLRVQGTVAGGTIIDFLEALRLLRIAPDT